MILYKYVAPQRIDVLENGKIRFSQPGVLNDPFEVKPSFQQIATDNEIINSFEEGIPKALVDEYKKLPRDMRRRLTLEEFMEYAKKEMPGYYKQYKQILDELTPVVRENISKTLDEKIGILSLTQTPKNKLMWSHYADSYKGFVIGFDSKHPFFNQRKTEVDEFGYLRKVEYHERHPSKPMTEYEGSDIFLIKGIEWEYEEEWRIIRPIQEADETITVDKYPICLFKFLPDIISEIIMGPNMSDDKKESLLALLSKYNNARVFQAKINTQDYTIEIHPI